MNGRSLNIYMIQFYIQANILIHNISKIPILKIVGSTCLDSFDKIKALYGLVSVCLQSIKVATSTWMSVYLMIIIVPTFIFKVFDVTYTTFDELVLFVVTFAMVPAVVQSDIFKVKKEDQMYLNEFLMNPTQYYKYKILKLLTTKVILTLPTVWYVFRDWKIIGVLIAIKFVFFVWGHIMFTQLYERQIKFPHVYYRLVMSVTLIVLTYLLLISFDTLSVNIQLYHTLLLYVLGCAGLNWLLNYKSFGEISRDYVSRETLALQLSVTSLAEADIALNVSDQKTNESFLNQHGSLKGRKYIDRAYHSRHKKFMDKFYRNRAIGVIVCSFVAAWLVNYMNIDIAIKASDLPYTYIIIPALMFSFGRQYCQMYFYHCDCYFMESTLFNQKQTCFTSYLFRRKFLLKKTMSTCGTLLLSTWMFIIFSHQNEAVLDCILVCLILIIMLILLENYHLAVYFLIQPYMKNGEKKPIHKILSMVELLCGIILFKTQVSYIVFIFLGGISTVLFIVCSSLLIKKVAFKTFVISR